MLTYSRYHWAFLIGPKLEDKEIVTGIKYHVKNDFHGWIYEEIEEPNVRHNVRLLARIMIAKIENSERLVTIIRQVPLVQADPSWRCRTWMMNVVTAISTDRSCLGRAELD